MIELIIHNKAGYKHAPAAEDAFVVGKDGELLYLTDSNFTHNDAMDGLSSGGVARGTIDNGELQLFGVFAFERGAATDKTTEGYITRAAAQAVVNHVLKVRNDIHKVWFEFWNVEEYIGEVEEGIRRLSKV